MCILTNISRYEGNQALKLAQLIEYNLRNILLAKPYTKCSGETIPKPFLQKIKIEHIYEYGTTMRAGITCREIYL